MTLKRVGGANELRRAHTDQVKPFVVANGTPRELRRSREPPRPSQAHQRRVVKASRKADATQPGESSDDDAVWESSEDLTEYVVEAIIGHFHTSAGFWFLVQWEGYALPTWEHESGIQAPQRITQYFRTISKDIE
jgi:hypothetical protein